VLVGVRPPTLRQWRAWAGREPVLRCLSYERLRAELVPGRCDRARVDVLLAALWRLTRHDRDAGGVLVACLVPGLRAIAVRYQHRLGREEAFMLAVAAVWDRVARFGPPASHVAYRLLWLAGRRVHHAAVSEREHAGRHQPLMPDHHAAVIDPPGVPVGVTLADAVDAGVIGRRDAWLVWVTHGAGLTVAEAAGLLGIGCEAAKKRRQRADTALKTWLETSDGTAR
jgi:hypothetical protein